MNEDSVARALGELQGTVRSMSEQWRRQDENATVGRRALYDRFEGVSQQVTKMSVSLDVVTQDVAELKHDINTDVMPTIDAVRMEAARRLGMMSAGKIFWAFLVGVAGAVGFAVHEMLQYFTKP
jgi:hypothetical protein